MEYGKPFETRNSYGTSQYEHAEMEELVSFAINALQLSHEDVILDVGAGYGKTALQFAKFGFKNIYANDLSRPMTPELAL